MNRREFLKASSCLITLAGVSVLVQCSSSSDPAFTSTSVSGHTHLFVLPNSVVSSSPAEGYTNNDSSSGGHQHVVTLTQAQLIAINSGTPVTVSNSNLGHAHSYTFTKVA